MNASKFKRRHDYHVIQPKHICGGCEYRKTTYGGSVTTVCRLMPSDGDNEVEETGTCDKYQRMKHKGLTGISNGKTGQKVRLRKGTGKHAGEKGTITGTHGEDTGEGVVTIYHVVLKKSDKVVERGGHQLDLAKENRE